MEVINANIWLRHDSDTYRLTLAHEDEDPVWWRMKSGGGFVVVMDPDKRRDLDRAFAEREGLRFSEMAGELK